MSVEDCNPPVVKKGEKVRWVATATQNLVRCEPSGTYFLRARVGGMPYRESLHTKVFKTAERLLLDRLLELRRQTPSRNDEIPNTLGEALARVRSQIEDDPSLKSSTRIFYTEAFARLQPGARAAVPDCALRRLSPKDLESWWKRAAEAYAPSPANQLLMLVRRALQLARDCGAMVGDPAKDLARVWIPRTKLDLVTLDQFRELVATIYAQRKARSVASGQWVEWMAYSGMRPGEIAALECRDVGESAITVRGGAEGTKNRRVRLVPINPAMADLIARMKAERPEWSGKLFSGKPPRDALKNACQRLGFPHMRIYDLRHLFATVCVQSDVDVPTIAKWMGHQDGGTLALKTYVHTTDEHSKASAAKVKF